MRNASYVSNSLKTYDALRMTQSPHRKDSPNMDNFLNGITLLGIPAIVLVPVLVQGVKSLGLPTKWAGIVAVFVGLLVAGLVEAVAEWPTITPVVRFVIAGFLLGLAASGAYSQYKVFKE